MDGARTRTDGLILDACGTTKCYQCHRGGRAHQDWSGHVHDGRIRERERRLHLCLDCGQPAARRLVDEVAAQLRHGAAEAATGSEQALSSECVTR